MRLKYFLMLVLLSLSVSTPAMASSTLGDVIHNVTSDIFVPLKILIAACANLLGYWLIFAGLMKLKDNMSQNSNIASDALFRLLGGGALIGLLNVLNAGMASLYNSFARNSDLIGVKGGAVQDCMLQGTTCVAQNIAENVVPVFMDCGFAIAYLTGFYLIVSQLYQVATSYASGRPDMPKGFAFKLLIGFAICNLPHAFTVLEASMGIGTTVVHDGGVLQYSSLSYAQGSDTLSKYIELIKYLFRIFIIFGFMAVWRGFTFLRQIAEGQSRDKTVGAAAVHILGGIALVNAKWTVCMMSTTFWGSGLGGFCS